MVNLLHSQSNVSHLTQMQVDGGADCRAFGDKRLFYVLFGRTTSVHVSDVSKFSYDVVGLVSVMLLVSLTLHSMAPAY